MVLLDVIYWSDLKNCRHTPNNYISKMIWVHILKVRWQKKIPNSPLPKRGVFILNIGNTIKYLVSFLAVEKGNKWSFMAKLDFIVWLKTNHCIQWNSFGSKAKQKRIGLLYFLPYSIEGMSQTVCGLVMCSTNPTTMGFQPFLLQFGFTPYAERQIP